MPLFLEYNGSEVWMGKHWDRGEMLPLLARFERLNLEAAARIFVVADVERRNLLRAGIADERSSSIPTASMLRSSGLALVATQFGASWASPQVTHSPVSSALLVHGMAC